MSLLSSQDWPMCAKDLKSRGKASSLWCYGTTSSHITAWATSLLHWYTHRHKHTHTVGHQVCRRDMNVWCKWYIFHILSSLILLRFCGVLSNVSSTAACTSAAPFPTNQVWFHSSLLQIIHHQSLAFLSWSDSVIISYTVFLGGHQCISFCTAVFTCRQCWVITVLPLWVHDKHVFNIQMFCSTETLQTLHK